MSAPQSQVSGEPSTLACSGEADLPAIRLVRVPEWGLPFDGDPAAAEPADLREMTDSHTRANSQGDRGEISHVSGTEQAASGQWAQQFARILAEALAGARPVRQIRPWTTERARVHLDKLAPLFGGGQRPRVLRVITTRPARQVIEMTVILGVGMRARALAVRLEQAAPHRLARPAGYATQGGTSLTSAHRWVCTDIEAA